MYIVYFKLGKEPSVKHFNERKQALAFGSMCKERQNDDVRVMHMDPTNPNPIVITLDKAMDKAGIKMAEPLVMPADYMPDIPRNEYELILEDAVTKLYGVVRGLAEQLKRLSN